MSDLKIRGIRELKVAGNKIIRFREHHDITQIEFARQCKLGRASIQRLEQGTDNCSLRTLVRVSAAMNLSIFELLTPDENYRPASIQEAIHFAERLAMEKQLLGDRISLLIKRQGKKQGKVAADIEREDSQITHYVKARINLGYVSILRIAMGMKIITLEFFNYQDLPVDTIASESE